MTPEQPFKFVGETGKPRPSTHAGEGHAGEVRSGAAPQGAPPAARRSTESVLRAKIGQFVHSDAFRNAILVIIVINAICLGLDTDKAIHGLYGQLLFQIDMVITAIFVWEVSMKLYVDRMSFFKDGWNVFDFLIVFTSILVIGSEVTVLRIFRILRVVRVLRVFRLFGVVKELRRVVDALFKAIPGMSAIIAVLGLLFYVSAVITTDIFGAEEPALFGSIGASIFTLFQIMTGDGWSDVVRLLGDHHPWAWAFFVPFIILTSFAVLNLFIAVIVDALQTEQAQALEDAKAELGTDIVETRKDLEGEIEEVSAEIQDIEDGQAVAARERAQILEMLAAMRAELGELRAGMAKRE
jgi:voltage-gated sodium channel